MEMAIDTSMNEGINYSEGNQFVGYNYQAIPKMHQAVPRMQQERRCHNHVEYRITEMLKLLLTFSHVATSCTQQQ